MDEVKIFIELPQEVEKWLIQNETSLARLLRQQGVVVRESHELNPFRQKDGNATERDLKLVLTVITSTVTSVAAAIAAVGFVADNILNTINKRPVLHISHIERVVLDAKGNVVFGKDGQPLYEVEEKPILLEPRAIDSTAGVQFKFGDKVLLIIGSP
ncbi:hypothetical protein VU08_08890, partial [Desulfobulbus sp. F5]|nr:hypothetical protein [Desulfobulbus sp. F5]